jgi:hypothetical protein
MSTTYQEVLNQVLNQVQHLEPDDQLRLLEELAALVRQQYSPRRKHRITEFKGLGKEVWRKIDVEKYIEEERNSWER